MIISLGDYHKIEPNAFKATGALDPILGLDTRLFIDPSLLSHTTVPELSESYSRIGEHFSKALKIIAHIEKEGDAFWKKADKMLTFPEVQGLCIGYSKDGTGGKGAGPQKRARILTTITQLVKAGCVDEAIFELVGTFEDGIGPDLISDMVAKIIITDLVRFSQRVCSDLGIPMKTFHFSKGLPPDDLPFNPFDEKPIILIPREILRDLPVAEDYSDISWISEHNEKLREQLNSMLIGAYKAANSSKKEQVREAIVEFPDVLTAIIKAYREASASFYDFDDDPAGETIWYRASRELPAKSKLSLKLADKPTVDDVYAVALKICNHFKLLLEDNQLCKLLYDKNGDRKHESAAQLLFFGIAVAYCEANDLDLSPESDGGRGPVDFKVSSGFNGKVVVEIKLTSNPKLAHGFETQLPIYQKAEKAQRGIYMIIDNGGINKQRWQKFSDMVKAAGNEAPTVIVADGKPRESASKAKE